MQNNRETHYTKRDHARNVASKDLNIFQALKNKTYYKYNFSVLEI